MANTGFRHTEATKQKLSALRAGENNPFFGRKHSQEFRDRQTIRTKQQNAARQYTISPRTVPDLSSESAAYLAGIIDGEGSITIKKGKRGATISVCNTSFALMEWLMKITGRPRVYRRKVQTSAIVKARCDIFVFEITGARDVLYLLRATLPYLTIKRDRAENAISQLLKVYEGQI